MRGFSLYNILFSKKGVVKAKSSLAVCVECDTTWVFRLVEHGLVTGGLVAESSRNFSRRKTGSVGEETELTEWCCYNIALMFMLFLTDTADSVRN